MIMIQFYTMTLKLAPSKTGAAAQRCDPTIPSLQLDPLVKESEAARERNLPPKNGRREESQTSSIFGRW